VAIKNLFVNQDSNFNFTAGADASGAGGDFKLAVSDIFGIAAGKTVNMTLNNIVSPTDTISFKVLLLNPGATFGTNAHVNTQNSSASQGYRVNSLDVITRATWSSYGTFSPSTTNGDFVRFDLSEIAPNQTVLTLSPNALAFDLASFNPAGQQNAYLLALAKAGFLYSADNPEYRSAVDEKAFITAAYRTLRRDLGTVTLANKTKVNFAPGLLDANGHLKDTASPMSATEGDLFDDFAFTAGLRRYYWDVYVDDTAADHPLLAHNYQTADASRVYTQAGVAPTLSIAQTFQTTLRAIENISAEPQNLGGLSLGLGIGGSYAVTDTGSHVSLSSHSLTLTLSHGQRLGSSVLNIGAFGEIGHGEYGTFSFIPRYGDVFGTGETTIYGGGLLIKANFDSGTFFDASIRAGTIEHEFGLTRDPWTNRLGAHSFKSDNSYLGAHLGLGQRFALADRTSLDAYARYIWARIAEDSFRTRFGDDIYLNSVDSKRVRAGARLSQSLADDRLKLYFGAAAEWELDGRIAGTLGPDPITNPAKTKGASVFGELGLSMRSSADSPVSVNLGAFGWAGRTRGIGGSGGVNFTF
jgi:hypothetical protein